MKLPVYSSFFDTANVKTAQYLRQNNDDTILICRMVNLSRHK